MAVKGGGIKRIKEKRCVQKREEERRLRNHRQCAVLSERLNAFMYVCYQYNYGSM